MLRRISAMKRSRLLVLGCVCLALCVAVVLYLSGGGADGGHGAIVPTKRTVAADDRPSEGEARQFETEPEPTAIQSEKVERLSEDKGDLFVEVVLEMVDERSHRVPYLAFEYLLMTAAERARLAFQAQEPEWSAARLDEQGRWPCQGVPMGHLWIRLTEPGWVCHNPHDSPPGELRANPRAAGFRLSRNESQRLTLELRREGNCELQVLYGDGELYQGELSFGFFKLGDDEQVVPVGSVVRRAYEPGFTIATRSGCWLAVTLKAPRGGFRENVAERYPPEEVLRGLVRVVIPAAPERPAPGGLILDHSGFPPDLVMMGRMGTATGGFSGDPVVLSGPGRTRTSYFHPGHVLRFTLVGGGQLWTSGNISLEPGEWRTVIVEPQLPAQLVLKVFDEDGKPISPALVSAEEAGHADWMGLGVNSPAVSAKDAIAKSGELTQRDLTVAARGMTRALSNSDGEIRFAVTWPGDRQFLVDAVGYESERIHAILRSGQTTDVGIVTLRRATAEVTVRLVFPHGESADNYQVSLPIRWGGRGHARPVKFGADAVAVIENVPAHEYQVLVTRVGGGQGWSKWLKVGPGERHEITIDVTREFGMQED